MSAHRDNLYCRVTLYDGEQPTSDFMVVIGSELADGTEVRERIASVAATGKTNTEYRGCRR